MKYKKLFILVAFFASACSISDHIKNEVLSGMNKYSLVASFGYDQSRVSVDQSGIMSWKCGDAIKVFAENAPEGARFETEDNGQIATFTGEMEGESEKYIALYPYSDGASINSDSLMTCMPETQEAISGTFDPASFLGVGISTTLDSVQFKNLCGGIRFSISCDGITRVVFRGNSGELISGEVCICLPTATLECTENGCEEVCLVSEEPLEINKYYFITIAPQCLEKGFTMEYYTSEDLVKSVVCDVPVFIRPSTFSTINNADTEEEIGKILDGIDLSEGGCANCYIVSAPGYYKFSNRNGKGEAIGDAKFASVIWETDNSAEAVHAKTLIDTVAFKKDYIYFHATDNGDKQSLREGNALVAIMSEIGTILWTWHIWFCEDFSTDGNDTGVIMDRNIGALDEGCTSSGLLYQWGRKEPFMGSVAPGSDLTAATVALFKNEQGNDMTGNPLYSQIYPTSFITSSVDWLYTADNGRWGVQKTVNDPCPAGWRVPTSSELAQFLDSDAFPLSGYLNNSFALTGSGSEAILWTCDASSGSTRPVKALSVTASKKELVTLDNSRARGCSVRCVADK